LFIKASAGTQALKNDIWNQIKRVDTTFGGLTCDIGIDPSLAPTAPAAPEAKTYAVEPGDTLSKIAQKFHAGGFLRSIVGALMLLFIGQQLL